MSAGPIRVLIADDDAGGLHLLGHLFEQLGCTVLLVASGQEATQKPPAFKPAAGDP